MKKYLLLLWSVMLMSMALLTSCGGDDEDVVPPNSEQQKPGSSVNDISGIWRCISSEDVKSGDKYVGKIYNMLIDVKADGTFLTNSLTFGYSGEWKKDVSMFVFTTRAERLYVFEATISDEILTWTGSTNDGYSYVYKFRKDSQASIDPYNGHEYVDLGLSVKWATCNIGAAVPESYGGYYAWGETEEKSDYSWATYKWCRGTDKTMTKYCNDSSYGNIDGKTVLEPSDDVAQVKWGGVWRIPTLDEQEELQNNCTWTWTTLNGVKGYRVTSNKNGNSIFLPAAGYRYYTDQRNVGSSGSYWSSSLDGYYGDYAYYLYFNSSGVDRGSNSRSLGHSVRAVCP